MKTTFTLVFLLFSSLSLAQTLCESPDGTVSAIGSAMKYSNGYYVDVFDSQGRRPTAILLNGRYYWPVACNQNGCDYKSDNFSISLNTKKKILVVENRGSVETKKIRCRQFRSE